MVKCLNEDCHVMATTGAEEDMLEYFSCRMATLLSV